MSATSNLPAC